MRKKHGVVAPIAVLIALLVALAVADPVEATTAAQVCATFGNTCAGTTAKINVPTTVTCPSTLDFVGLGFPDLIVNSQLKTTGASLCVLTLDVGTLTVSATGSITNPSLSSSQPGEVTVNATAAFPATAILINGLITVGGGAGAGPCADNAHTPAPTFGTGPCIELFASGDIVVNGKLTASALTTGAYGGLIDIVSTDGKVAIGKTAVVTATSTDPGGTHIQVEACAGIDIAGTLNATAKVNGAEVHLFSREYINITGGKVIADLQIGGGTGVTHEITIEARDSITLSAGALVSANGGATGARGGTIDMVSTEGAFSCDAGSLIRAYATAGGGSGGAISLRAFDDVTYNCNGLDSLTGKQGILAVGNAVSGRGGTVLLQSFDADVRGTGSIRADGPAVAPGTIVLTGAAAPLTAGGICSVMNAPAACFGVATLEPNTPMPAPLSGVKFGPDGIHACTSAIAPDVSVIKSTSTPVITAGDTASYDIQVSASGVTDATNVTLSDILPTGLTWAVGGADSGACSISSGALTCAFGTMTPGDTRSLTLTATTTTRNCPSISNTATVHADEDLNSSNNTSGPVNITVNCPDVKITKSTSTPVIAAGANAVYTVEVTANGPGSSTNVTLKDTLPAGLNWTVGGADAAACSPASPVTGGTTLTCSFGTMALGTTKTITLTAATTGAHCPAINNTAMVTADVNTVSTNNSSGPIKITVNCPDVKITKSTSTPVIAAGTNAVYSVAVTANGPGSSTDVTLKDTLPAGLNWTVGGADAAACSPASPVTGGTTLTCSFGTMTLGTTKTITLTAATTGSHCPAINNTATVTAAFDTVSTNNSSGPIKITVNCPDVKITKSTSTPVITAGANAVYSVAVTANGPGSSTNVTLKDTLPAGLNWTVGGADAAACSPASPVTGGTTLTCSFGTMTLGTTKTITLTAATTGSHCPAINNTATVTAELDTVSTNNSSGPIKITVNCPDVKITKSTSTPVITAGANAVYSVAVTANGPGTSTNVTLKDTLPAGLNWTVGGADAAACSPASPVTGGTTLTCSFGTMTLGTTKTITLTAATTGSHCPAINNTATVTAGFDTVSTNNSSGPIKITVNCPDVKITKSTSTSVIAAGANAVYSVAVTANGPGTSTNVTLKDTLPTGLNWTVGGAAAAACSPASPVTGGTTLTCSFGTMASGTTKTITLTAATTASHCPAINNTATVSAELDTVASNNTSGRIKITVNCADVKVSKTTTTPSITAGDQASYGITVTANGPASSTHVILTDVLPAGLTWTVGGPDKASCSPGLLLAGGTTLTCNFGTMAPLATKSITLTATTTTGNCPSINNTATVSSDADTNSSNNTSGPVKITVNCTCPDTTIKFSGTSSSSGTAGNIRTFTVNGVSVKVSAFSRTDSNGAWATAYLGLFGPGLGVTNSNEGSGASPHHKADNQGGRHEYVLFEFSSPVVVDQVFLDAIGADSDMSVWIGTRTDPFNNHITLSDGVLSSLGPREDSNVTGSMSSRWADINAGRVSGNVLVIAASTSDTTPDDEFKISKVDVKCP